MNATYYILLISTLVFPFVGLFASRKISIALNARIAKAVLFFFLFHNIFFLLGFSLRGDYIDYCIFSLEYLVFCFVIFRLLKIRNLYARIARVLGLIAIVCVFLMGIPGLLWFIMISQRLASNRVFLFSNNGKTYETRRYSSEFEIIPGIRYGFDTYRIFSYLPVERKIDHTDFFEKETTLNIGDKQLHIQIQEDSSKIVFSSTNGNSFSKSLK